MDESKNESVCVLCSTSDEKLTTLHKSGLDTLTESSKQRRDHKFHKWKGLESVLVHDNCRRKYNKPAAIEAASKEVAKKLAEGKKEKKDALRFNFEDSCLFCCDGFVDRKKDMKEVKSNTTTANIVEAIKERGIPDNFHKNLLARLNAPHLSGNLVEAGAKYHADCMSSFYRKRLSDQVGRPPSESTQSFIQHAIDHINRAGESQFSLNKIKETFTGPTVPDINTIKNKLSSYYTKEQIEFLTDTNDVTILYGHKISKQVWKDWYAKQAKDPEVERVRIMEMAAKIVLEDLRKTIHSKEKYVIQEYDESNIYENIPESLTTFLDIIVKTHKETKKKEQNFKWSKRVAVVSHILMSLARPRSFLSPILVGLSAMMHKNQASKELIQSLANIGLCATYDETVNFEESIMNEPKSHEIKPGAFVQYIYDNADHNTRTLDGKRSFHAMGGIKAVTPASSVVTKKTITRLLKKNSSTASNKVGFYPLQTFEKLTAQGLKKKLIENVISDDSSRPTIAMNDFIWMQSKHLKKNSKGWAGFMQELHADSFYRKSKIIALPFVNNKPDNYNTVYTVLVQAAEENKIHKAEDICFVTFDQPLYMKARYIVECIHENIKKDPSYDVHGLSKVRVRLGGFHTILSFLGSIGSIMGGSGLREALCVIYSEKTADKTLGGHEYSKAVRAHSLIQVVLAQIIFELLELSHDEKEALNKLLQDIGEEGFKEEMNKEIIIKIREKFMAKIEELKKRGPTAQLWIQYWDMLVIVRDFIKAERSGDWNLHLKCIERMLPYFHASSHHKYAKSAHLYLQDMLNLKQEMSDFQYELFVNESCFTIRRSDKFWCGVWSDMTIEQVLMRSMKTQGGLTHGRGMSEKTISTFVLTMTVLLDVCNVMEDFCDIVSSTSYQHTDSTNSRITQDDIDIEEISNFFKTYYPFPVTPNILSIYSGMVGGESVNCHKAREIGLKALESTVGKDFESVKYKTKMVLTLKTVQSTIKINEKTIPINPLLLFQRICGNIKGPNDMKNYLQYELAPIPLSLFTENGLRKNNKAEFYHEFLSIEALPSDENLVHVIDGGYLLHKVVWQKNDTVEQIINKYYNYIQNHFARNSSIVFDGYPDCENICENSASGTKSAERLRRQNLPSVPHLKIELQTKVPYLPEKYLSNDKNKMELIKKLCGRLSAEGYTCKTAVEDADALIVRTAIEISENSEKIGVKKTVVVVGQDVDLLVLINELAPDNCTIYFLKVGTAKVSDLLYSSNSFAHKDHREIVAFLHCFSGCDTNSAFAGKGKKTTIKSLLKVNDLKNLVDPFYTKNAKPSVIARNGCKIIAAIYNSKKTEYSLHDLRYKQYQSLKEKDGFKLEKIPPTVGAATQHSYRAYYQLQTWLGNELSATSWGWKEVVKNNSKILLPHYTDDAVIPKTLLKKISCSCKKGCSNTKCSCRKLGLHCTDLCTSCTELGSTCKNVDKTIENPVYYEESSDDPEIPGLFLRREEEALSEKQDGSQNEEENSENEEESSENEEGTSESEEEASENEEEATESDDNLQPLHKKRKVSKR